MNILIMRSLIIFILLSLGQPSFAQSINDPNLQKLFFEDPSLINSILKENKTAVDKTLISKSQNIANTKDNLQIDLSQTIGGEFATKKSMLAKYFYALTGENLNIYGSNEFNQPQDDGLLFFNTIGKNYQLAPGDTIQITITGLSPSNKNYQVMNDGTISLENVYPLNVNNLNLNQVSKLVLDKILLDDASAEVFVRLNNARLVTVQISGNVKSPRTIAVPAYTPLSRVIAYSGGISESGSLRNISLSQIGEATQTIDFYNFLQNASSKLDPLIKNGARIFVPFKGPTVAVTGFVNNPGIYELPNDKSEISIKNILSITGTSFLPSGARLKILYFDSNGQIATRLAVRNESIKEGEVLQVDFIETRDLNISRVSGAVLKNFEIKTNTPLSIKEILKNGAVLSLNAYRPFALINGEEVRAINLNDALVDENITLPPGSDLLIFNKVEYLSLVAENPNRSLNPTSSILAKAKNIAEIYLDGHRMAYVPVNNNYNFRETIRNFYVPGPKTIFDIALIESNAFVEAIDLKTEIGRQNNRELNHGDKLFIFEDKFYDNLIKFIAFNNTMDNGDSANIIANTNTNTNTNTQTDSVEVLLLQKEIQDSEDEYLEALSYSSRILQQANLISIKIDDELNTYLPYKEGVSSSDVLKKLQNRLPQIVREFIILQNMTSDKRLQIKNLNNPFKIKLGEELNFISTNTYRLAIMGYDDTIETNLLSELKFSNLLSELKSSDVVKVYYDGSLVLLLPPNHRPSELKLFEQYTKNSDLYKLYVGLNTRSSKNQTWDFFTYESEDFFSNTNNLILGPYNVVSLFSNSFIRNEFINNKANINGVNFNINSNSPDKISNLANQAVPNTNLVDGTINNEGNLGKPNNVLNTHIEIMKNSLRTISGSVQFPGAYPVAKKIRLSNFISTAGLIEHTAKSIVSITEAINQKDRLVRVTPKNIKINDINFNNIVLSGIYYLDIPLAINDAITGVIELKGEVLVPGKYSFTRSEKLQDIIRRAGGLSDVAYPLGAELHRVSAKELEKDSNNILADQLEASILNLAQSSLEGAGDQINVVLGYATQLRNQPTVGRMALNILDDNLSNPIFLEDGDILNIPKRPSHVSVVGSVQRPTLATYIPGQHYTDYLQSAGGLTKVADIRKAYLLLPNGQSRQLNKSTLIPVGSTIIIPPKLDRLSILGGTDIISKVLNNISDSILSIQNVD
ncbi:SLBB domain-containing protein [Amylibacter sp.]|nr:SLBB domain-containing protein [Amylibacter sp.]